MSATRRNGRGTGLDHVAYLQRQEQVRDVPAHVPHVAVPAFEDPVTKCVHFLTVMTRAVLVGIVDVERECL